MSAIDPTNNTGLIIDDFINYATAHLGTVGGVINTLSIYSPITPPAPGVISWTGYTVQPSKPSVVSISFEDMSVDEAVKLGDKAMQDLENSIESIKKVSNRSNIN
jgi:hypothetical protein